MKLKERIAEIRKAKKNDCDWATHKFTEEFKPFMEENVAEYRNSNLMRYVL